MVSRSWIVPVSSIMASISSGVASPICSNRVFIRSSISKSQEKADFSTSRMVMPFCSTAC